MLIQRRGISRSLSPLRLALILALAIAPTGVASAQEDGGPTVAVVPGPAGAILADAGGWTLYTWDGDAPGFSGCYDACAVIWPPVVVSGEPYALEGLPGILGAIERADGLWQVTYDGWPLYYYGGDVWPGDNRGDWLVAFGARWYVVPIGEQAPMAAIEMPAAPVAPAAPSFSGTGPVGPPPFSPPSFSQQPPGGALPQFPQYPSMPPPGIPVIPPTWFGPFPPPPMGHPYGGPEPFSQGGPQGPEPPFVPIPLPHGAGGLPFSGPPIEPSSLYPTTALTVAPPSGAINVTWTLSPFARSFRVYQSTGSGAPSFTTIQHVTQSVGAAVTATTVYGLLPGTSYLFQVRAIDPNGAEVGLAASTSPVPGAGPSTVGSPIAPSGVVVPPPGPSEPPAAPPPLMAPTGVTVSATSSTTATLNWTGGAGTSSYQVAQAFTPGGPFNLAATSTTMSATVSGLTTNTTYYFQIRAVDAAGNVSPASETVSAATPADFVTTIGVSVMSTTSTTVTLSWTPSSAAKSYQVGQGLSSAGPFHPVATSATSMATVGNLTPNTTYYFQILALDAAGNILGSPSSTASATTTS